MILGDNLTDCAVITDQLDDLNVFEFGYAVDMTTDKLISSGKVARRLFTSDWDFVTILDVNILIFERGKAVESGSEHQQQHHYTHTQTISILCENEGIDSPVSISSYGGLLLIGLPWMAYETYAGRAYLYRRQEGVFELECSLSAPESHLNISSITFGAAVLVQSNYAFIGEDATHPCCRSFDNFSLR